MGKQNPIFDTKIYYVVEFSDGQTAELATNVIAQNMFAMCNTEGNQYLLLEGLVDHRKDPSAVDREAMYVDRGSNRQLRKITKGWQLCVEWKDGTTSREQLADLKESNPVEVGDYAVTHGITSRQLHGGCPSL
ncbi:Reverse transcriptase (RNA-dependent DNA polymerase) [Fragilaria crotonensis]|nr:Reverse transcriptase (RNA-dependent DNA polymerase) [Fragilaria crotonensis]